MQNETFYRTMSRKKSSLGKWRHNYEKRSTSQHLKTSCSFRNNNFGTAQSSFIKVTVCFFPLPCSLFPPYISSFSIFLGSDCHSCVKLSVRWELVLRDITACVAHFFKFTKSLTFLLRKKQLQFVLNRRCFVQSQSLVTCELGSRLQCKHFGHGKLMVSFCCQRDSNSGPH